MSDEKPFQQSIPARPPTWDAKGSRKWLFPERRDGKHAKSRKIWAVFLIAFYLLTPFLTIAGRPALRFDVNHTTIYAFGQVFHFSDGPYLIFLILSLALLFFFVSSLKGRWWCGYACPQTVFLEWVIRPVEEFFEGKASKRRKTARKPTTLDVRVRKALKYLTFFAISSAIAHIFLSYFFAPEVLFGWMMGNPLEHWTPFLIAQILTALMMFDFTYFREQFCSTLCPYTRFQALLMDEHTPTVAYDIKRGEPRAEGGDCIDCDLCIKVCPTGIDIRNGFQLECIQCERCIDACDDIMRKVEKPEGLVRIASLNEIKTGEKLPKFRLRPILYGTALTLVVSAFLYALNTRKVFDISFMRIEGQPYQVVDQDHFSNVFRLRLENNTDTAVPIAFESPDSRVSLTCAGCDKKLGPFEQRQTMLIVKFPTKSDIQKVSIYNELNQTGFTLPIIAPLKASDGKGGS